MQFNVADLLKGPRGATRTYAIDEPALFTITDAEITSNVRGQVILMRTQQGVLVEASLSADVLVPCARCLQPTQTTLNVQFAEEFRPTIDIFTGNRLWPEPDENIDSDLMISTQHILDLEDVARQELEVAIPLKPLCRPACLGLCPHCGKDLNEGSCTCSPETDQRWGALHQVLADSDTD